MNWFCVGMMSLVGGLLSDPCQAFELKKNSEGKTIRWVEDTVVLRMSTAFAERFGQERALAAARGAASAWSEVPGVPRISVQIEETPEFQEGNPYNCIHLGNAWDFPGNELALTHALSTPQGHFVAVAIVVNGGHDFDILDAGEDQIQSQHFVEDDRTSGEASHWHGHPGRDEPEASEDEQASGQNGRRSAPGSAAASDPRFDLQAVLTHEMGHVLGLAENPDDEEATMHPDIGPGEIFQRTLAEDDRAGAAFLYEEDVPEQLSSCQVAWPGSAAPSRSVPWLLLFATSLLWARRKLGGRLDQGREDDPTPGVGNASMKVGEAGSK